MIYSPLWGGLKPSDIYPNEFERSTLPASALENGITIAAIAKNESRYIVEWMAYHFAIGVDRIVIYSNDTDDDQCEKIEAIAQYDCRVSCKKWPSISGISPQLSAYNDALKAAQTPWIGFIDIDEFIVPLEDNGIHEWLATIPDDVSSVHLNWRGFGSSGRQTDDYDLVTRAFTHAALPGWSNNHHFKSIARTKLATEAFVHNILTKEGRRTLSDFGDFETIRNGLSNRVTYHRIQLNHYQCKTFAEFSARMSRGDANVPVDHPSKSRDGSEKRFRQLDLNEEHDISIGRFDSAVDIELEHLRGFLCPL